MELDRGLELQQKNAYIVDLLSRIRAPLTGFAIQEGTSSGLYADGWVATKVRFTVKPLKPVASITLRGWRPRHGEIAVRAGEKRGEITVENGAFEVRLVLDQPVETPFDIEIDCEPALSAENDDRALAFVPIEVRVE
jgi:hypothetical protein